MGSVELIKKFGVRKREGRPERRIGSRNGSRLWAKQAVILGVPRHPIAMDPIAEGVAVLLFQHPSKQERIKHRIETVSKQDDLPQCLERATRKMGAE